MLAGLAGIAGVAGIAGIARLAGLVGLAGLAGLGGLAGRRMEQRILIRSMLGVIGDYLVINRLLINYFSMNSLIIY